MRKRALFFAGCVLVFGCDDGMDPVDAGSDAATDAGTSDAGCSSAADCPAATVECMEAACVDFSCTTVPSAEGTRTRSQVSGDCLMRECDGAGAVVEVFFNPDVEDDSNPCTTDSCLDGDPQHTPVAEGMACGDITVCDANGNCVGCNVPSDCPGEDGECGTRTCVASMCGVNAATAGTLVSTGQTDGDCQVLQCDGAGGIESVDDTSDVPVDGAECTMDVCSTTSPSVPSNPPLVGNPPCASGAGTCDDVGVCIISCTISADCPATINPECGSAACVADVCEYTYVAAGTSTPTQTSNDCVRVECDGSGGSTAVPLDTDVPADDGNECTIESCSSGTPRIAPAAPFATCTSGVCTGAGSCAAAPLDSGDFYVVRAGTGAAPLTGAASEAFLDRFSADGTPEGTIAFPTVDGATGVRFTVSGNSTSEGGLSRSADARYLVVGGYAADLGTIAVADTLSADVPRVIARIDASGNVDTTTRLTSAFSGDNIRGATSDDGTRFWASGNSSGAPTSHGVHYVLFGSTGASVRLYDTGALNTRASHIFGGQLYTSTGSGTARGVMTIGAGLPETAGQTATPLPGNATADGSPFSFVLFDLDPGVAGLDTMYVADDRAPTSGGGVQRWRLDGTGTWTREITFAGVTGLRGLAGITIGDVVVLYATTVPTTASPSSRVVRFVDDGTGTPVEVTLATAATNTLYRGVALAPR